jgi:hypothetical protein
MYFGKVDRGLGLSGPSPIRREARFLQICRHLLGDSVATSLPSRVALLLKPALETRLVHADCASDLYGSDLLLLGQE